MHRSGTVALTALAVGLTGSVLAAPAHADPPPGVYHLVGDPDAVGGSKFEGIGVDRATDTFYVTETTGGEIHRGTTSTAQTAVWLEGDGVDGRFTARGITVDKGGRVYIAGGPNRIEHPDAPDLWVYSPDGALLAALQVPGTGAFLNDVAIGPDGAAYFTNSNAPQIFRVADTGAGWEASLWKDASAEIPVVAGFNLNGIVRTANGNAFIVAQSNAGLLWRVDSRTGAVEQIDTGGAVLTGADGLVRRGRTLVVVRNFARILTTVTLDNGARTATLVTETPTDPTRVFTTAKFSGGRLLLIDSKFDEPAGAPPYEVISLPVRDVIP